MPFWLRVLSSLSNNEFIESGMHIQLTNLMFNATIHNYISLHFYEKNTYCSNGHFDKKDGICFFFLSL